MSQIPKEDSFIHRHIGPQENEIEEMLRALGFTSLDAFTAAVVPSQIRISRGFALSEFPAELSEHVVIEKLSRIASRNDVHRSLIGMGYSSCITPPVIQRNILENPGWYTQYTPYQAEISQGRLEALLNFQTMISDLTGLPISNASLLDEGTAAAEAMTMSHAIREKQGGSAMTFFVSKDCHPQTIGVVQTRAEALGFKVVVGDVFGFTPDESVFGALVQYPTTFGLICDYKHFAEKLHRVGALLTAACDLLALALLTPPGEFGADIAVGNSQRFGVPLGYGGPHAAFFATKDEYKRLMPGRLIGVSKDSHGNPGLRLSLQTREQHIRREKATSNICTAQVLLAIMASMYGVYHGPEGIRRIAKRVNALARLFAKGLEELGIHLEYQEFFDTVCIAPKKPSDVAQILDNAAKEKINLRATADGRVTISFDEVSNETEVAELLYIFGAKRGAISISELKPRIGHDIPSGFIRKSRYLTHPVFNSYRSETEFLRYVRRLEAKDLSLGTAMIPLGSCTMKLNATSEMIPVSWKHFSQLHPFAPLDQAQGYAELLRSLEKGLAEVTGFDAVSLQPNAGSQGEYAGLLAIRGYHVSRGDAKRTVCLIPKSAHGTNPASAVMAGMKVVVVECDDEGNVRVDDLKAKAEEHKDDLAALMVTYPSTHGVFEESIKDICAAIHAHGGQVYMDGANLNALVGLCRPAEIGADVCHINLHKTFCIPHGGGGPGMGPIAVKQHLAAFLPGHPVVEMEGLSGKGAVSAAPWGSASILPISWVYMACMGAEGLKRASEVAILNANYIAKKLEGHYPLLFKGKNGLVAHECILDLRDLKNSAGVEVEDVAKRLMDYGFHAPTISWPVAGTMMVEPTESESKAELDRFCDALIAIRNEIREIEQGKMDKANNPLKNAPHTALHVMGNEWPHPYSRETAAFPAPWTKHFKFWPAVGRVDSGYGDKNLVCTCPPLENYL